MLQRGKVAATLMTSSLIEWTAIAEQKLGQFSKFQRIPFVLLFQRSTYIGMGPVCKIHFQPNSFFEAADTAQSFSNANHTPGVPYACEHACLLALHIHYC